jgi:hypothetical protein
MSIVTAAFRRLRYRRSCRRARAVGSAHEFHVSSDELTSVRDEFDRVELNGEVRR